MADPTAVRDALQHLMEVYDHLHTNDLRNTPMGHWVNEAFVVRLLSTLEAHGVVGRNDRIDQELQGWEHVDICRRLRNEFAHATGEIGDARTERLEERIRTYYGLGDADSLFANKFLLPKDKVLRPMHAGCLRYAEARLASKPRGDSKRYKPRTAGDLEAVILAESFALLAGIVGPYIYTVSGVDGQQQAVFQNAEKEALFFIRAHEFLATATEVSNSPGLPANLSLLEGGLWLAHRNAARAAETRLVETYEAATQFFSKTHRLVFWAPSVSRHLRMELTGEIMVAMRANMEKHHLLRLSTEIRRLQSRCSKAGSPLTDNEAIAAREDFEAHLRGAMSYHATEIAEHIGRCLLGLHDYASVLYLESPTNNLDAARYPDDITDDVFRYMYVSTAFSLAGWTDERIEGSIPQTAPTLKAPYQQHADWAIVEREQGR